jgi:outer membrane protein OmpA-like peptidoglycan-associated protein
MVSPDKTSATPPQTSNTTTKQSQSAPLSSDSVNATLGGDSTVRSIDVTNGAVTVNYDLGFVNDDNDIIMKSSQDAIDKMQKIFKDNRVTSVTIASFGTFTDPNGNDKDEQAVSITVNKATADKTNWNGVNDMLASDPTDLLKISDGYTINPSVYNSISLDVPISK